MAHPRIIAIANQKGGVGKTTTTANLGHAFLRQGKRVLAIDLDPQASLSISLGLDPAQLKKMEDANQTIYFERLIQEFRQVSAIRIESFDQAEHGRIKPLDNLR